LFLILDFFIEPLTYAVAVLAVVVVAMAAIIVAVMPPRWLRHLRCWRSDGSGIRIRHSRAHSLRHARSVENSGGRWLAG